ncbi:aldose epimerase family protein [Eudoraea adriatica]|uniref:aldose epimerase family protein n=1 Tax=Eudoraea adriatica TaxID=446681 RepID=UPI00037D8056|nr:aldose epimerase family protein [Eudoraea adriatica]
MEQVTIKNDFISLSVLDYGAIIQKLLVKDKEGKELNLVVGLENPKSYLDDHKCLGACVGRYAGRISNGGFQIEGNTYNLYTQNGVHLHGGKQGFAQKYWKFDAIEHREQPFVKLTRQSPHMEEGYPGNLKASVTYKLIDNSLQIIHEAITDRTTILNLTNHSYFCLDSTNSIDHYQLQLQCPEILETDNSLLPTGKLVSVKDTQYDFLTRKEIGKIRLDTAYVVSDSAKKVAELYSPVSGMRMTVESNQPAVIVYTPPEFGAICFETQNYPDAPNILSFPSAILHPGETYINKAVFTFDLVT